MITMIIGSIVFLVISGLTIKFVLDDIGSIL